MRSINKSRMRGRGSRRPNGNSVNKVFESSGPEGKVRGNAQQIIDKYEAMARDAFLAGDRIAGENFKQHCEHYVRILSEAKANQESRLNGNGQQQPTANPPASDADAEELPAQMIPDNRPEAQAGPVSTAASPGS